MTTTLEEMREKLREVEDRWHVALIAQREAAKVESEWRKMMCEYYGRSEGNGIDTGTEMALRTVAE